MTSPVFFSKGLHEVAESHYFQTIEDRLEAACEIPSIEYYFDASEVVNMIQGVWALDHHYRFNMDRFNSNDMLVYSLAFKNLLGKIHMLPPHQDELLYKLKEDSHLFPSRKDEYYKQLESELFGNLKISDLVTKITDINEDTIRGYVQGLQLSALDLYKTDNLLRFSFWRDRYKYILEDNKIVQIDNSTYDVTKLTQSNHFNDFMQVLEKHRGRKSSNITDALAFTILQEKVTAHNNDKKNVPLPIFYAGSSKKSYQAARELIDTKKLLTYDYKGQHIPVIRHSEYFILNVIYDIIDQNDPDFKIFKDIRDTIENHKDKRADLISVINRHYYYGELKEDLWHKITNQFFYKTWLENEGYKEMTDSILEYINYNEKMAEKVPGIVQQDREEITKKLQRNIVKFEWVQTTISELFSIKNVIETKFADTNEFDIFRDLGMTRFSFNDEASENIQRRVSDLLDSYKDNENEERYRQRIVEVLGLILDGLFKPDHQKLVEGMGVLWVFEKYRLINKIGAFLEKKYDYYQIPLLYAASIHQGGGVNHKRAEEIVQCIESKERFKSNYKVWIGLAYIYWLVWNEHYRYPSMPEMMPSKAKEQYLNAVQFKWIQKSIKYSEQTIKKLDEIRNENPDRAGYRNRKFFYIVNLYLFTLIQTAKEDEFNSNDTSHFFELLRNSELTPEYWQPRFHDTIARYYLRKAVLSSTPDSFKQLLKLAAEQNYKCEETSKRKEVFNTLLREKITEFEAEGFDTIKRRVL